MPQYTRISATGEVRSLSSADPATNPDLPSYQNPEYRSIAPRLRVSRDIFQGITAWVIDGKVVDSNRASRYLPKEEAERPKPYLNRLLRSLLVNFYRPAIRGFAGLLSDFELSDRVPQSLRENEQNINLQGDSLTSLLAQADELVLRDGFCGVLVDFPQRPVDDEGRSLITDADAERRFNLRPYLILVERSDILNWRVRTARSGKREAEQVTIRRTETRPVGLYGSEEITTYQVWESSGYETFEILVDDSGIDSTPIVRSLGFVEVSLSQIPIVFYSTTSLDPFLSTPPLYDLALINICHYQLLSDYFEVMYKCNRPVPVRTGLIQHGSYDLNDLPPLIIGPNSVVDVPEGGMFGFAEPTGAAIAATRQALHDLEMAMLREALNFFGDGDTTKTAREVDLRSSQTRATISLLAEQKESAVEQIFSLWSQWMNQGADGGTIEVNKSLLRSPLDSQVMQVLSSLVTVGQLDIETFAQILQEGKVLPKSVSAADVINRISGRASTIPPTPQQLVTANQPLNGETVGGTRAADPV